MPMPAPAAYAVGAVAVISLAAASFAFKEYVYEPHIEPWIEQWAESFLERRRAQRQQAAPVAVSSHRDDNDDDDDLSSQQRAWTSQLDHFEEMEMRQLIDLDNYHLSEASHWRSEASVPQRLRLRHQGTTSEQRHYLVDEANRRVPSVIRQSSQLGSSKTRSRTLPRRPPSQLSAFAIGDATPFNDAQPLPSTQVPLPTPDATIIPSPPHSLSRRPLSRESAPSLSQVYPLELDQEQGLELLSRPSSRSDSPFSNFSQPLHGQGSASASETQFLSFSSAGFGTGVVGLASPTRTLSDLDFLSDAGEPGVMSPMSEMTDMTGFQDDFHRTSEDEGSISGWESAR